MKRNQKKNCLQHKNLSRLVKLFIKEMEIGHFRQWPVSFYRIASLVCSKKTFSSKSTQTGTKEINYHSLDLFWHWNFSNFFSLDFLSRFRSHKKVACLTFFVSWWDSFLIICIQYLNVNDFICLYSFFDSKTLQNISACDHISQFWFECFDVEWALLTAVYKVK